MSWEKTTLGSVADIFSGYAFKSSDMNTECGTPLLKIKNISSSRVSTECDTFLNVDFDLSKYSRFLLREDDFLVAMTGQGSVGRIGKMINCKSGYYVNQRVAIVRVDAKKANPKFIFSQTATQENENELFKKANGAGQPNISAKQIGEIELVLPDIDTQNRLANILSAYDDLIENNQKQIKLLEEAAQRLYKEWFVDLRFPGYENTPVIDGVPQRWRVLEIGDAFKTLLGGTPSREKSEYWKNGTIPWINSGKVNELRVVQPSEYINDIALNKSATKLLPKHTTLVAITGATLGQVSYTEIETCTNQSVVGIIDETQTYSEYVYCYVLDNIKRIIGKATGGAQQHINKDIVNKFPIVIPEESISSAFQNIAKPYFEKINALLVENIKLAEARDRLLPKLMSGEIEV